MRKTKYIFVAGGVMSGIGKGVATSSISQILKSKGFSVQTVKIDPYLNVDAGTMNPLEHGEVFVTDDGTECDQDIGHYERFLNQDLTSDNYLTTGRVYQGVIRKERNLQYGGRCVQVFRDIPSEVISRLKKLERKTNPDFILIEIGGTVGDYENILFLEAARILKLKHPSRVIFILVTYLPIPPKIGEMKSKPTQQAVRWLNMAGIQPEIIIGRAVQPIDRPRKKKISIFCNVSENDVISAPDIKNIYEVPLNFEKDDLGNRILEKFGLKPRKSNLKEWEAMLQNIKNPEGQVKIGIVGKYFKTGNFTLMDSYISVIEAIKHAAAFYQREPKIIWLSAEDYEKNPNKIEELGQFDGIIIPGGFGNRGVEGKIRAIRYCRECKIPFLGLCLGMQLAVIEFARNVLGLKNANSTEFKKNCQEPIIDIMPEQKKLLKEKKYGATMRLGAYQCHLRPNTKAAKAYKQKTVFERHRHRYELNNKYKEMLEQKGMIASGINPQKNLVEIVEIPDHPFFVATQFHPEFKSRPLNPHPLFKEFIKTAIS